MVAMEMRFVDAFELMVKRHADSNPNSGFRVQLQQYEKRLFGDIQLKPSRKSSSCTLF
jgi:hypothetical protein